ncbi:MAG: hypothetical protein HFI87_00395 [Bacilli bacterium]|nr:hypothetical protein [Bacilli bacterium]
MNTIDSKFKISNNNLKAIGKTPSTKTGDTFAKLIKSGLASSTSVSEHFIWQTYNVICEHISNSELSKGQLVAILPTVNDALKAYADRIEEAVNCELIERPKWLVYKKSL